MHLAPTVLGSHAVDTLRDAATTPILVIGSDRLTRSDLAQVVCFNFTAARNLSAILNKELKVKSLRQVYEEIPPSALALPRLGAIALAVLGAAFEAVGIGGNEPLVNYVKKHKEKEQTFHTMKHHAQLEERRIRLEARTHKRARQAKAHTLRIARFEERQAG